MIRLKPIAPAAGLACLALLLPTGGPLAQTIDVASLPGGIDVTITRLAEENVQVLAADGVELLRAPAITIELDLVDATGAPAGMIVQAASPDPACASAPYGLTVAFGEPWLRGPIGQTCTPYAGAAYPGGAILFSPPQLHSDGDAVLFDLEAGAYRLGPIAFAPQPERGWDALDGEVGGYNALSPLDLYAAWPVHEALVALWQDELFAFAQHLATRTAPQVEGNLLFQTGCLPAQCAFAIGMLAVDPTREEVYAAYFNEGAPAIRPPLETWSLQAVALYDAWRAGDLR